MMKPVWDEKEQKQTGFKDIILNSGKYTGKIKKVEWVQSEYSVTEYNHDGTCLSVWIDIATKDGKTKRVFDKISITSPTKLNQLRVAAGLKPVSKGDNFDESPLSGKNIQVEVDKYTAKSTGKISNIVKNYLQAEAKKKAFEYEEASSSEETDERVPF